MKPHLFAGRYEDGSERYVRWGKQFRELFEMFFDAGVFSPVSASLKKIGGKTSPLIQRTSEVFTGVSPSGFENREIKNKVGWERVFGITKALLSSPLPFSMRTVFQPNKEFKLLDIAMPSSKGMSRYKGIEYFKLALERKDERMLRETWAGADRNGLPAFELYKTALSSLRSENTKSINENIRTLQDIDKMMRTRLTERERRTLLKRKRQLLKSNATVKHSSKYLGKVLREFEDIEL